MSEAGVRGPQVICIAHPAYRLAEAFAPRAGQRVIVARNADELKAALPEAEILLTSFLWRNEYAEAAPRLRFIQSISAGTDQFSREILKSRGIRLASAQGANERVVAEHAIALILAMTRHLGQARDSQHERRWAGMISDPTARQQELGGRTLVIVGLGRIGTRLATLARAFDLEVIGVRRSPRRADDIVNEVVPPDRLLEVLPRADFLALTCPLTPETERLIRAEHFAAMKPSAYLINVARGKVVDEPALIEALSAGRIAGGRTGLLRGGAAPAGFAALDLSERARHATLGRRDEPLRGQRHRHLLRKPGAAGARGGASERDLVRSRRILNQPGRIRDHGIRAVADTGITGGAGLRFAVPDCHGRTGFEANAKLRRTNGRRLTNTHRYASAAFTSAMIRSCVLASR